LGQILGLNKKKPHNEVRIVTPNDASCGFGPEYAEFLSFAIINIRHVVITFCPH